jgi:diaminopimelate epimerase
VQVISRREVRLRVWERGTGITLACGSGACAVVVAGVRKGMLERRVTVNLDGGALEIEWLDNGHVCMAGPAAHVFVGRLSPEFLAGFPAGVSA